VIRIGAIALATVVGAHQLAVPVDAYLDPGTGSALLQGLIGAIAVGTGFIAYQWQRIRALFSRRPKGEPVDPPSE
jgi:hypothetical protein